MRVLDGPTLSHMLSGKEIEHVLRSDRLLVIRCTDGTEVRVAWVDGNGDPVTGQPAIAFVGRNVIAKVAEMRVGGAL